MRERKYITVMDPFQSRYGNVLSAFLVVPALIADVLWVACTLFSLGKSTSSLSVWKMQLSHFHTSVFAFPSDRSNAECDTGFGLRLFCLDLCSCCDYLHTNGRPLFSGLHWCHPAGFSFFQFGELLFCLFQDVHVKEPSKKLHFDGFCICWQWLCVPFMMASPISVSITETAFKKVFQEPWLGTLNKENIWKWIDDFLLTVGWIFVIKHVLSAFLGLYSVFSCPCFSRALDVFLFSVSTRGFCLHLLL